MLVDAGCAGLQLWLQRCVGPVGLVALTRVTLGRLSTKPLRQHRRAKRGAAPLHSTLRTRGVGSCLGFSGLLGGGGGGGGGGFFGGGDGGGDAFRTQRACVRQCGLADGAVASDAANLIPRCVASGNSPPRNCHSVGLRGAIPPRHAFEATGLRLRPDQLQPFRLSYSFRLVDAHMLFLARAPLCSSQLPLRCTLCVRLRAPFRDGGGTLLLSSSNLRCSCLSRRTRGHSYRFCYGPLFSFDACQLNLLLLPPLLLLHLRQLRRFFRRLCGRAALADELVHHRLLGLPPLHLLLFPPPLLLLLLLCQLRRFFGLLPLPLLLLPLLLLLLQLGLLSWRFLLPLPEGSFHIACSLRSKVACIAERGLDCGAKGA